MENNTNTTTLPEGLGLRIRDTLLKILELPVHEGKKVSASIKNDAGKLEAVIKVDLRKVNIDMHNFIHSHFLRSDAINNDTNTRDLHYRIPDRYLEDVKTLHGMITSSEKNTPEIKKVLETIDSKVGTPVTGSATSTTAAVTDKDIPKPTTTENAKPEVTTTKTNKK